MRTVVTPCSRAGCRRTTSSPSGRCHDHGEASLASLSNPVEIPRPVSSIDKHSFVTDDGGRLEQWGFDLDRLSRDDGPASIRYRPDGRVWIEEWWLDGIRDDGADGPTTVEYFPDGETVKVQTYTNGHEIHREDGPARITYARDGSVAREEWFISGRQERLGGPAVVSYSQGRKRSEEWMSASHTHRLDGPAYLGYAEDGETVVSSEWRVRGQEVDGPEGVAKVLDGTHPLLVQRWHTEVFGKREDRGDTPEVIADLMLPAYAEVLGEEVPHGEIRRALVEGVRTYEGIREVSNGAPAEWVRAYESRDDG